MFLPPGNARFEGAGGFGHSHWALTLPYIEQGNLADIYDYNASSWTGGSGNVGKTKYACISRQADTISPLPVEPPAYFPGNVFRTTLTRLEPGLILLQLRCCPVTLAFQVRSIIPPLGTRHLGPVVAPFHGGMVSVHSTGGVLVVNQQNSTQGVSLGAVTDGTSNTMMFAEQSDWIQDDLSAGSSMKWDARADGNHGFNFGTRPDHNRVWNLITVLHPINTKNRSQIPEAEGKHVREPPDPICTHGWRDG